MTLRAHFAGALALSLGAAACNAGVLTDDPTTSAQARERQEERDDADDAMLAGRDPASIPAAQRAQYLRAVERWAHRSLPPPQRRQEPDAPSVLKVLALGQIVGGSDPALASAIRAWLLARAGDFATAYQPDSAPPSAEWHQAEAAWIAWLSSIEPTLREQEALGPVMAVFQSRDDAPIPPFPGLDRTALGFAIVDLWERSGRPSPDNNHPTFQDVLCGVSPSSGKLMAECGDTGRAFYRSALATDAGLHRFTQAVLARKDPQLVVLSTLGIGASTQALEVLHDYEVDPALWRTALLTLARTEEIDRWLADWLVPEMRRVWPTRPALHGAILYAMAIASGKWAAEHPQGVADFPHFARDFGGPVTQADFLSFLEQSPRSVEYVAWIMSARTKGWSVADAIVPRLDAYFALPERAPSDEPEDPGPFGVTWYLCHEDHDLPELQKFRVYFARRAQAHPGDPLNLSMDSYGPKDCKGP